MGETPLSRRTLLMGSVALLAGGLAACTAVPGGGPEAAPTQARTPPPPPPTTTPIPTPTPAPLADVEAVIAAHEGQVPQQWGMDVPGVVRTGMDAGTADPGRIFLTLDACGGPGGSEFDERLIRGLQEASAPATLFLNLRWIQANPELAAMLAADPLFELANHGSTHVPLSVTGAEAYGIPGTASARDAAMEVWANHLVLTELTGTQPRWFRPGTAHLDDVGLAIAQGLGEQVLGFSINGDGGATYSAVTVAEEIGSAEPGAVILAHMNQPESGTAEGVLEAVAAIRERGFEFGLL